MGPAGQQVGWAGRTFGLTNTRAAWLTRLGAAGWLAGFWFVLYRTPRLTTGESILAVAAWVLVLAVAARGAVRDMFGPVFFYEVVRLARRPLTYRLRFAYVAVVAGILVLMYVSWLEHIGYFRADRRVDLIQTQALSGFANQFFEVFVVVQYLTVILLTPVYVAGTVAVEKERKTLEFLLATDLRNREIVFGKLAARVTNLLMFVFAGLPIVAVLQLFGGIDPNLLLAAFAATVVNVIGLSAVAVWTSVMVRRARDAIVLTYMLAAVYVLGSLIGAVLAVGPVGAGTWWQASATVFGYSVSPSDGLRAFAGGNPVWVVIRLEAQGRGAGGPAGLAGTVADLFREFATFWGVATVLAIGTAVWRVRAVALAQSYGPVKAPRKARGRAARRHPAIGANPVFWREVFVETGVRGGWLWRVISVVIGILICIPVGMIVYEVFIDRSPWRTQMNWSETWNQFTAEMNVWVRVVTGAVTTLMLFAAAVRGAGAVSGEKDRDTWVSLISAPLSADQILWGKWWGCVLGLRRGYAVLVAVWSIGLSIGAVHPATLPLEIAIVAVLVSTFTWVGLFCSMRAKNSLNASIQAFFLALFLAGGFWAVLGLCCGLPMSILDVRGHLADDLAQVVFGCTPPAMAGCPLFRSFVRRDMQPFDFDASDGMGFVSLILGLALWAGLSVVFGAVCLTKFRRVTNRVPVYLPEELRMRAAYARRAAGRPRPVARPVPMNGTPDTPTLDERTLAAPDEAGPG